MRRADRQSVGGTSAGGVAYAPQRRAAPHQASRAGLPGAYSQPSPSPRDATNGEAELASLFRELRRVQGLSLSEVAQMLDTRLEVIAALEMGNVKGLPAWHDTVRIVTQYALIARFDAAPVLSLIRRGLDQGRAAAPAPLPHKKRHEKQPERRSQPSQGEPSEGWVVFKAAFIQPLSDAASSIARAFTPGNAEPIVDAADIVDAAYEEPSTPRFGGMRLNRRKTAGLVAALFIIVAYFTQGSTLQASLATLQPPIVRLMRGAQDYLLHRAAPVREGLRWIEVEDPRSRRADRLPPKR